MRDGRRSGARPDTWMPLYWGDYLKDTGRLTTEGHGAYLLLIADYWTNGEALPDDDDQLAAIARLPLARWRQVRRVLEHFFEVSDGCWRHKRVESELERATDIVSERSAAGKAGAKARWGHKQTAGTANGNRIVLPAAESASDAPRPGAPAGSRKTNRLGSEVGSEARAAHATSLDPKWCDPTNRNAFALQHCLPHLPGRDNTERWLVAMAAEDPASPHHQTAVGHMLAAAKRAGVGWISPERRARAGPGVGAR
jgi:uncharacterized protein YdaU (DUF1376 family)